MTLTAEHAQLLHEYGCTLQISRSLHSAAAKANRLQQENDKLRQLAKGGLETVAKAGRGIEDAVYLLKGGLVAADKIRAEARNA